jgi:hypothetical protein
LYLEAAEPKSRTKRRTTAQDQNALADGFFVALGHGLDEYRLTAASPGTRSCGFAWLVAVATNEALRLVSKTRPERLAGGFLASRSDDASGQGMLEPAAFLVG